MVKIVSFGATLNSKSHKLQRGIIPCWYEKENAWIKHLHRIQQLPRRERQPKTAVRVDCLDDAKKQPDAECERVRLQEYGGEQRRN